MNKLRHMMDLSARFADAQNEKYMSRYLKEQLCVLDSILGGKPYFGVSYYVPGELLALFDLQPVYMERMAGFGAANRMLGNLEFLRVKHGMPSCGCSYQLFFDCMIREGIIPPPAAFIASSYACDDAWMYCRAAAAKYRVPLYFTDVMQASGEKGVEYLGRQLEQLYLELGREFNEIHTIGQVVDISNKTMKVKQEIDEMRFKHPGIQSSMDGFKLFTLFNDLGRSFTLEIFESLLEGMKEKTAGHKADGSPRILWMGIIPLYRNRMIEDIEKNYGCKIVYEEMWDYGSCYLTQGEFFYDLARRITSTIFFSFNKRLDALMGYAKRLDIDGVIHFSQRHCRFLPPMAPLLGRELANRGIAFVELHGDAADPSCFDEVRYNNRLDAFFEQIYSRKQIKPGG